MRNQKSSFDFLDFVLLLIAISGLLVYGIASRIPDSLPQTLASGAALYLVIGVAIFALLIFVGKFIHTHSKEPARQTRNALTLSTVAAILFTFAVAFGIYLARDQLYPFFMYRPWINGAILSVGLFGLALCLGNLGFLWWRAWNLDRLKSTVERILDPNPDDSHNPFVSGESDAAEAGSDANDADTLRKAIEESGGFVGERCRNVWKVAQANPGRSQEAALILSDADVDSTDEVGTLVRYLLGVMVFVGLIGTFWGLLNTVSGVKDALSALTPESIDDPAAFLVQLKASMAGMLGGMSTAFSTSLFGLGGAVILGFVEVMSRQARSQLLADLDEFVVADLLPAATRLVGPGKDFTALQDTRKDLQHLLGQQAPVSKAIRSSGEETVESLNAVDRRLEQLVQETVHTRETIAQAETRTGGSFQDLCVRLEKLVESEARTREHVRKHMETATASQEVFQDISTTMARVLKEMESSREASDRILQAIDYFLSSAQEVSIKRTGRMPTPPTSKSDRSAGKKGPKSRRSEE